MVAEADDALMEKFFEAGTLTQDELTAGLARAVRAGKLFPVFCTSGLRNIGVQPLADAIVDLRAVAGRSAVRRRRTPKGEAATRAADDDGAARAVGLEDHRRSVRRPHHDVPRRLGHRSRRTRPSTTSRATRPNASATCWLLQGKTQTHVPELHAGDLGAVAKLKDTHTGDTLGDKSAGFAVPPITFPEPVLAYAIEPKSRERRGQDRPGHAAAARGGSVDRLRPRSADARTAARRARASCTSR